MQSAGDTTIEASATTRTTCPTHANYGILAVLQFLQAPPILSPVSSGAAGANADVVSPGPRL